jgi:hypothetical protein
MDSKQPLITNGHPNNTVIREIVYVKDQSRQEAIKTINNYFCVKLIAAIISIVATIIIIVIVVEVNNNSNNNNNP